MVKFFKERKSSQWFRLLCCVVLLSFCINVIGEDAARAWSIAEPQNIIMSPPGMLMASSPEFSLPTLKGISIDPNDPFKVNFVVDSADQSLTEQAGQEQVNLLVRYFLSFLTLPEEELWVNLSPYERNRIITPEFETTNAGRDMLVEDYTLKQLAASLTYPDHQLGKEFWKRVFKRVQAEYGTNDIPVTSFSKVWVVPDRAVVYEDRGSAFIGESRLKVLTEEDYLSIAKNSNRMGMSAVKEAKIDRISSEITREIIIPELEREVNEGKYFAPLRQMYNSLILAIWFKKRYKEDLIYQVYVNQKKTTGIALGEKQIKEKVYARYLKALKKGVYNYIKEEADPLSNEVVPRKYFSGGFSFVDAAMNVRYLPASRLVTDRAQFGKGMDRFTVLLNPIGVTKKTLMSLAAGALLMAGGMHEAQASEVNDLTQINKNIAVLKADIATKENTLHKQFMDREIKGGEYQMRWASIGHEESKLKRLQKQAQLIEVERQSGYLLPQMNKDITALKADIAAKRDKLHKDFMHGGVKGGEYMMRSSAIGYEERKLEKLQKQMQLIGAVTPAVAPTVAPVVAPIVPLPKVVVQTAPTPAALVSAPAPAAPVPTTTPAPIPQPVITPSTVTPPVAVQVAGGAGQVKINGTSLDITNAVLIPVEDHETAVKDGIVTGFDPDKKEYKAGERIFYLLDPELKSRIEQLGVQPKTDETTMELARANQEKESSVITAPHDLTIEGETAVPDGTQVSKGEILFRYFDRQRVRVNFNVPTGLSYFNRVQGLAINGVPVKRIVNMKWSFDPLEKNTQVSLEIIPSSPMSPGQAVSLNATLLPSDSDQDLNSVVGKGSTLASVRSFEQYVVRSPVDGPVKFIVHEGQRVHKGQVLAYVYRLNGKLFEVRASSSGVVTSIAGYEQRAFQSQDELLRIRMGSALVGNINDIKNPVLFPRALTINNGDPVVVETPQGIRLPGRVSAVNQTPYSSTMDLSGFQALEVMAVDQQGILQTNLPVKIILSKDDQEKKIIGEALARAGKEETNAVPAGSPPPPDEEINPDAFILSGLTNTAMNSQQSSMDLTGISRMVGTNELVMGNDVIKALQAKAAEAYPKASSFSLTGGVYMTPDGKVAFNGGVMGALNNGLQGGISSGSAISAAAPLVLELIGNVTKVLSGEVRKETARAVENTKVVYHHMETGINHHVNEAQDLLIDIGDAQQKIERLKQLEADLEKAGSGIGALPGESTGAGTVLDIDQQLEQKTQDVKAQILELEAKQKEWTASLNFFISQSNTYSNKLITAVLPWGKDFPAISTETETNMEQSLTGPGSVNPRMQEVMAADKFAEMSIGLQKLKRLPVINIGSVVVNNGAGLNPFYDLSEPWTGQRSSTLQGGANSVAQGQVDLVNTGLKTEKIIVTLAEKNSKLNIAVTKAELSQELQQAVGSINSLSEQIREAEKNYQYANDVWKSKVRSDLYLPYQLIDYRIEMNKRWQEVIDLKAQYLKEEAALRSMGLLGAETSTQQDLGDIESYFQSVVSNSITGTLTNDLQSIEEASDQGPVDPFLAPGVIDYQVGPDVSTAWALMHSDPMATMKKILIEDPNIFVRADALHHFLDEYQNNKEFLPSLKDVILHSSHPDVVWGILKYMGQRDDRDMRFFIEIIDEAESDNNQLIVDLGFQALGDIFTAHPEDLQKLTQANFTASSDPLYPEVNPETANKVFLSFLALQPDDSIAKERFLQSDFWNADDLARIHQRLAGYIDHHDAEAGIGSIKDLAKLISDSVLRKEAVANIDEVFQPGAFASLGALKFFIQPDVIMHVQITENAQGTRDFLTRSPDWRNMEKVIHPKLWARVNQETQDLLSTPQQVSGDPLYHISPSGAQHHELAYFESLGLDGQQDYIQRSQDILELTRILALQTPLRTVVLDRLMATDKGRSVVLKTYVESQDTELLQLIESRPWMEALRVDVPKANDAADNYIFRAALQKMYDRTGQEGYLYLRLRTYPDLELRSLVGPLRDASIKRVATERAIKVYEEQINITPPWAGWSFESTRIKDELANINHMIDQELDPKAVDQYINQRINADGDIGAMLKNVKNVRDQIAEKISMNDQNIPKFPLLEIIGFIGCGLTFVIVVTKKVYGRLFRTYANPHRRIGSVLFKLLGPSDKAQMGDMVSEAPDQVFGPTTQALKNWYGMVSNWDRKEHVPAERIITEVHTILNCAEEALRLMPYSADLMYSGQGQDTLKTDIYQKTYSYYIVLALDTLNMMNEHLKGQDLNEIERQQVQAQTTILVDYIHYATRFRRILYDRGSIERVIGYKFSTKHWTEWTGLAPAARVILWDTFLWRISEGRLKKELPLLLDEGNSLMPGFYQDKQTIIDETNQLLKKATNRGGSLNNTLSRDARHKARMGAFMGRLKYLIGFGWTIYAGIMLLLSPGLISPQFSSMVFALLVTTTYFTYWGPYLDILGMDWNKDIAVELKVQDAISKKILNLPPGTSKDKGSDENIVALSQLQDAEQTKIELDTKRPPNVDMIVIVSEDAQHVQDLEKYAHDRREKLIRNDIPVAVMSSQYQGSGNVYLDMLLQAKRDLESPAYKQQYPHLKSWKQSRVMFVFHGKDASKNEGIQYSLLDSAIENGYRLARNDPEDIGKEGGNIIVYSRDAYFGPIPYFPKSGIALLTSKVNRDELKGYGFVNTGGRFASNTEDTVFQVYEKLDLDALEDDPEPLKAGAWRNLEDRFMLSNHVLKQFPVLNGRVSIAADAVEMLTKIAEHTQANNLWEQWPRHLSGDLLIPLIMISKLDKRDLEKEINDYVDQRSEWGDLHEDGGKLENGQLQMIQGYLEGFYETIEKYYSDIPINAFLPHSKMSLLMHVSGDKSAETAARFKKTIPVVEPGGVDLSGTRDIAQFNQNTVGPEVPMHGPVLTSLKFFKGFDFQVIEYQPISNPVEFFSSMARSVDHHEA